MCSVLALTLYEYIVDRDISHDNCHLFLEACRKSNSISINGLALYGIALFTVLM